MAKAQPRVHVNPGTEYAIPLLDGFIIHITRDPTCVFPFPLQTSKFDLYFAFLIQRMSHSSYPDVTDMAVLQGESMLIAAHKYCLGVFRVRLENVDPHPLLRLQDQSFVNSLEIEFRRSGDRGGSPILALAVDDAEWPQYDHSVDGLDDQTSCPSAPPLARVICFDGRQRLEAWRRIYSLDSPHCWLNAVVYKLGELSSQCHNHISQLSYSHSTRTAKP